jgi:Alpha/beta hydrolase domain
MVRRLMGVVLCALMLSVGVTAAAHADEASPTVTGPVTGGNGVPIVFSGQPADRLVGRETFDLASVGYEQTEFFLSVTASAFAPVPGSTLSSDGRWTVEPSSEAAFKFCGLFGTTVPLTAEQLDALYGGHSGFVAAWGRATVRAFLGGFLRPEDTFNLVVVGAQSDILR